MANCQVLFFQKLIFINVYAGGINASTTGGVFKIAAFTRHFSCRSAAEFVVFLLILILLFGVELSAKGCFSSSDLTTAREVFKIDTLSTFYLRRSEQIRSKTVLLC